MIQASDKFKNDINSSHIQIYPLVVLGTAVSQNSIPSIEDIFPYERTLRLSTIQESIKSEDGSIISNFYDLNVRVSNIKESLDLKQHNHKIGNVNLTLSNYKIDKTKLMSTQTANDISNLDDKTALIRFSDISHNFFNEEVRVYYKTQSCEYLEDMLLCYVGIVRKISHDEDNVYLQLEDRTDFLIHKDVPIANIGFKENVYSKEYINKPIPFTYGKVTQAPVIPYIHKLSDSNFSSISIIPDDVGIITNSERNIEILGFGTEEQFPENTYFSHLTSDSTEYLKSYNPLYIYKGDYFRVLQDYNSTVNVSTAGLINFPLSRQYTIEETEQSISIFKDFVASYPQNPPAANELQTIKVRYPNQCTLLKSSNVLDGDAGSSNTGIINIEVPQGILNAEASIDNSFYSNQNFGSDLEFDTFCQIPNNFQVIEETTELEVHEFTPFNIDTNGWAHPLASTAGNIEDTSFGGGHGGILNQVNYLAFMFSWCNTYIHKIPAKFIQLPPIDLIKEHVDLFLLGKYGSNSGDDAIIYNTSEAEGIPSIFDPYRAAEFRPQTSISPHIGESFVLRCDCNGWEPIYMNPSAMNTSGQNYFEYFNQRDYPENEDNLTDYTYRYDDQPDSFRNNFPYHAYRNYRFQAPADSIYTNDLGGGYGRHSCNAHRPWSGRISEENNSQMYCPTSIYKFSMNILDENNVQVLTNVYVGIWIDETMYNSMLTPMNSGMTPEGENAIFINLFNLQDDKPYLYESINQFPNFDPNHLTYKEKVGHNMKCKFNSTWNGVGINHYVNNDGVEQVFDPSYGHSCLNNNGNDWYNSGDWQNHDSSLDGVRMKEVVGNNVSESNQGSFGGKSWFIYFYEEENQAFRNLSDSSGEIGESLGEFNDSGATTRIAKHTLIPCNLKNLNGQYFGHNFNVDYILDRTRADLNISVGTGGTFEERLSVLFPMGDLVADDSFNVDTFVYGKVNCNISSEDSTGFVHDLSESTTLKVDCVATEVVDVSTVDFNAESADLLHGTTLIELSGSDSAFNSSTPTTLSWDISSQTGVSNYFTGALSNRIESWDAADKFNAISLIYRLEGDTASDYAKISTDIFSLGVLQFINFEKALDSPFYADIKGRTSVLLGSDGTWKYTRESTDNKDLIEKPADVLFHITELELNKMGIINRDKWIDNREGILDINLAFSIKEITSSKDIFLNISKNSNIYPVFDSDSTFSYKKLKEEYSDADINQIIESKDVIKYSYSKTPVSDIKTLVNVKYRKDYETDEYTRETGYCDALDFYGNATYRDVNQNVIHGYKYTVFGIERESNIFNFESDYIRDYESASKLRDFILMHYCNQHTIISLEVPLKYLTLQVGDIVKFDSLINNLKAHGEDYASNQYKRNNQIIYPYFMVTSITKTTKIIKLNVMQLHRLKPEFHAGLGSLSRGSEIGISVLEGGTEDDLTTQYNIPTIGGVSTSDLLLYESYLLGQEQYFTTRQLINGDVNNNASIDVNDLNIINILLGLAVQGQTADAETQNENQENYVLGDITGDGTINVTDIVALVSYILGSTSPSAEEFIRADYNNDGIINVTDVVAIVNEIISADDT